MKSKVLICFAFIFILLLFTGCMLPEYQLGFSIDILQVNIPSTGYARVTYRIYNSGSREIYNASLKIRAYNSSYGIIDKWTSGFDLAPGRSITNQTLDFYFGPTTLLLNETSAEIISAGWDDSNN